MKTLQAAVALLLMGCAPAAHRAAGPALAPAALSSPRATVASTLDADDPLDAPWCGLPTLLGEVCPTDDDAVEDHAHHHHHHGETR